MRAIAVQILDEYFGAVRFEGDAVCTPHISTHHPSFYGRDKGRIHTIPVVDNRILNNNILRPVRIPTIRVLRLVLAFAVPGNVDSVEEHIRAVRNKLVPLRRVAQLQRSNSPAVQADHSKQDRAQDKRVLSVQVVPDLAIAVERAPAIDVHVFAAKLEEGRCVLERVFKGVGLPVIRVVCELNAAEDFCL